MLLQANGEPVENRLDLTREINLNGGSEMTVLVEREGQRETMALRPHFDADSSRWLAGVTVELADSREVRRSRPIWEAVPASFVGTWELLVLLKQSVTGMVSAGVGTGAFRAHRDRADDGRGQPERRAGWLAG